MAEVRGAAVVVYTNLSGTAVNLNQSLDSASCFVETKDLDLGRVDVNKFLQKIFSAIEGVGSSPNLKLTIKWRNSLDDALKSVAAVSLDGNPTIPVRPPGAKFFRLRYEDTNIAAAWKLSRIDLFGRLGGRRF
jgi:hypothetical protein